MRSQPDEAVLTHLLNHSDFYLGTWFVQPAHLKIISEQGETVGVEPKVMGVLLCLVDHQGEVVARSAIMDCVWPDTYIADDTLSSCVSQLRRVLRDTPAQPIHIETIRKVGYRLISPITYSVAKHPADRVPQTLGAAANKRLRWSSKSAVVIVLSIALGISYMLYSLGHRQGVAQNRQNFLTLDSLAMPVMSVYFLDSTHAEHLPTQAWSGVLPVSLDEIDLHSAINLSSMLDSAATRSWTMRMPDGEAPPQR